MTHTLEHSAEAEVDLDESIELKEIDRASFPLEIQVVNNPNSMGGFVPRLFTGELKHMKLKDFVATYELKRTEYVGEQMGKVLILYLGPVNAVLKSRRKAATKAITKAKD